MKAVLIGAGPAGCLLALGLRKRGFNVLIYEKGNDPRYALLGRCHSFNLTLSQRGLQSLDHELCQRLYTKGVQLPHRVIHHSDGTVSSQAYGVSADHHLLSIPRRVLHATLIDEAERSGARFCFRHECISADPRRASATFASGSIILEALGDILVGCDGASSVVRRDMSQTVGIGIKQGRSDHGYIEFRMPANEYGEHPLAAAARTANPACSKDGFHIWPRGNMMLIAQPNIDRTYTATLFLPFTSKGIGIPSFEHLGLPQNVTQFFQRYFPDAIESIPTLSTDFHAGPPAQLKTVSCDSYHYERTVLLGDAAHTMLPFYGQGINCSFEDVRVFLELLDRNLPQCDLHSAIRTTLKEFTARRTSPCKAIADLSETNFQELATHIDGLRFRWRSRIEKELYRRHPERFVPLYCGVAFSTVPYDEVIEQYRWRRRCLDIVCDTFDIQTEADNIVAAYRTRSLNDRAFAPGKRSELELLPARQKQLLDLTVSYILRHQDDLASGKYPASYVHDSINVSAYEEGKRISAELREDDVPRQGADLDTLLSLIFDQAIGCGTNHPHRGFMAHIPSGGLLQGAVGSFIAEALNRFPGVWVAAPGLIQIESNVIRWFCSLLGYDDRAFGYLTTSGSIANMMGLMCACRQGKDASSMPLAVYTSEQGHFSIQKAARLIGIPPSQTQVIPTRPNYRMDVEELMRRIKADRAHGLRPACVVATAGTTNTGAIDDLSGLAAVCRNQGIWLHVDATFGGFFRITARGRAALRGIEEADSIAVDAHKSLFLPHGNSALLVRDRTELLSTFRVSDAAYLPGTSLEPGLVDFCNYGPELSREIRGLTAWLPMKMHGVNAFEQCLDEKLDLATYLAEELERIPSINVIRKHALQLPVVVFKLRASAGQDHAPRNQQLCEVICSAGRAYVTTTVLPDEGLVIRACILNHRTDRATVDELIEDVRSSIHRIEKHSLSISFIPADGMAITARTQAARTSGQREGQKTSSSQSPKKEPRTS